MHTEFSTAESCLAVDPGEVNENSESLAIVLWECQQRSKVLLFLLGQ